jgi:hypothetical protein
MREFVAIVLLLVGAGCGGTRSTGTYEEQVVDGERCVCAEGCARACPVEDGAQTSYRKVIRNPDADPAIPTPADAFQVIDVVAAEPLDPAGLREAASAVSAKREPIAGYRADFVRGRGNELGLLFADGELVIYRDNEPHARLQLGNPSVAEPLIAVSLVDERAELVVRHQLDGRDLFTVCRVIGKAIGRVFELELAQNTVEFVHLGEERAIRVRSAEAPAEVYRWNQWEGMFRIPEPAPTAPPQ